MGFEPSISRLRGWFSTAGLKVGLGLTLHLFSIFQLLHSGKIDLLRSESLGLLYKIRDASKAAAIKGDQVQLPSLTVERIVRSRTKANHSW